MQQLGQIDVATDEDMEAVWRFGRAAAARALRCALYFLVAFLLLSVNSYGLGNSRFVTSLAIGLLGAGTTSARIGLAAIAVLVAMALITPEAVELLSYAV